MIPSVFMRGRRVLIALPLFFDFRARSGASNSESIQSVAKRVADALKFCESQFCNCIIILVASHTITSVAQSLYVGTNLKHHSSLPPPLPSKARPLDRVAGAAVSVGPASASTEHAENKREINIYISGGWDAYSNQDAASSSTLRDSFISSVCKPIEDICMRSRIAFNIVDYRSGGVSSRSNLLDLRLQAMKSCNVFVCLQDVVAPELTVMGISRDEWQAMCQVASVKAPWAKEGSDPVQLEITAAALSNQPLVRKECCFFGWPNAYARAAIDTQSQPSPTDGEAETTASHDASAPVSADGHPSGWVHIPQITAASACIVEFSSPANLFAVLRKKIAGRIRAMFPMLSVTPARQWLWNIRLMMNAVADSRVRGVVDRWEIIEKFDEYAKCGHLKPENGSAHHGKSGTAADNKNLSSPLVLISESGMGKTSSLVNWMRSYRASHPGHRVIYHAMLPSPQCSSMLSIIMRLSMELSPWIDESGVYDAQSVKALFSTALLWANESAAQTSSVVIIVLDAVNHTHDLSWVPTFLPPAIRLVISATSKSSFDSKTDAQTTDSKRTISKEGTPLFAAPFAGFILCIITQQMFPQALITATMSSTCLRGFCSTHGGSRSSRAALMNAEV
jgi:hypothetical protein